MGAFLMKSHANQSGAHPLRGMNSEKLLAGVRCLEQLQASDDSRAIQFPASKQLRSMNLLAANPLVVNLLALPC